MREYSQPSPRTAPGSLGLFLVTLLCTCQDAMTGQEITYVNLIIEPGLTVESGTNVTLECTAGIISTEGIKTQCKYQIFKDDKLLSTGMDSLRHQILDARAGDTGRYKCEVTLNNHSKSSSPQKLKVEGLQRPLLNLSQTNVTEGEGVMATCSAPKERGVFYFYFYDNMTEIHGETSKENSVEKTIILKHGRRQLHCVYTILVVPDSYQSNKSNIVTVDVDELRITPILSIEPARVIEGDQLKISCIASKATQMTQTLTLSKGSALLDIGKQSITYRRSALATDSGEYRCKSTLGEVYKWASANATVKELFSKPVLTVEPLEVFEGEKFTLNCFSNVIANERIQRSDVKYSIYKNTMLVSAGTYRNTANISLNGRYFCEAKAKNISKRSTELNFEAKVLVSQPFIYTEGDVILGQPFSIHCFSQRGHLPIVYTLLKQGRPIKNFTARHLKEPVRFQVSIWQKDEILAFRCEAKNNGDLSRMMSSELRSVVIEPPTETLLTVVPVPEDVVEGNNLTLICGAKVDSLPVTFKWYRTGQTQPLSITTVHLNHSEHQVKGVGKEHSGGYYCEASNKASQAGATKAIRSKEVFIQVKLAFWKKGLIVAVCLLLLVGVVLFCVIRYKTKRGKREMTTELSVKPSSPKSDDSLTVSLTRGTEVYNAHKARADGVERSVWCERPSDSDSTEQSVEENPNVDPDVEYTEVIYPQPLDPSRAPLRKGTDTVYSELQNNPQGLMEVYHAEPEPAGAHVEMG